jgi:hypothetical protein
MAAAPLILQEHLQTLAIQPPFAVAGRALPDSASGAPCAGSVRRIRRTHIACPLDPSLPQCAILWLMALVKTAHFADETR